MGASATCISRCVSITWCAAHARCIEAPALGRWLQASASARCGVGATTWRRLSPTLWRCGLRPRSLRSLCAPLWTARRAALGAVEPSASAQLCVLRTRRRSHGLRPLRGASASLRRFRGKNRKHPRNPHPVRSPRLLAPPDRLTCLPSAHPAAAAQDAPDVAQGLSLSNPLAQGLGPPPLPYLSAAVMLRKEFGSAARALLPRDQCGERRRICGVPASSRTSSTHRGRRKKRASTAMLVSQKCSLDPWYRRRWRAASHRAAPTTSRHRRCSSYSIP